MFDQTPLPHPEISRGKSIPIVGKRKKQQLTGTFTVTKARLFLPMQLIYKGKATLSLSRSLPKRVNFPDGFDLAFTLNHWVNEEKCNQHIEEIVVPYIELKQKELRLNTD